MKYVIITLFALFSIQLQAQEGHHIKVKLTDVEADTVYLGFYLGQGQYFEDTAAIQDDGFYEFSGEEKLDPGVYLVVVPPENHYFQLILNEDEQHITLATSIDDPISDIQLEGSEDTKLFYSYMSFLGDKRVLGDSLNTAIQSGKAAGADVSDMEAELAALDLEVKTFQENLVSEHGKTLTAAIVRAGMEIELPEFEGDDREVQLQRYKFYKKHYFDNVDMSNPGLLRSPLLFNRIQSYIDRLTPRHPDSISLAINYLLDKMKPSPETFKYYTIHYLNEYAKSKIVGMDAVYVNIVDRYYSTGQAVWTDKEQMDKIIKNANELRPILIGKQAPEITLERRNGDQIKLYDIKSPFTILYIWQPDCGHCKKQTPKLIEFYKDYQDKGVTIVAVCMKFTDETDKCWDYVDDHEGMELWFNLIDKYNRSKYPTLYNVKSTPQLFVLDENKKIISKRIGVEQLPEVMDALIERHNKELIGGGD